MALLGPRQCGKTTLAREVAQIQNAEYFDLEDPTDLARLTAPKLTLEQLDGLVIIDEFQQRPDLLPLLRVLLDRQPLPARFLLLGSASPDIVRGASESLAGRIEFVHMSGFDLSEVGPDARSRLWLRGGFPPAFLAASDADSFAWRGAFVQTFVERDLRRLGFDLSPQGMRRFLTMLAHHHGQRWNASAIGSSLQLSHTTVRRYLDLLSGAFVARAVPPWFQNVGKRVVKAPKVYLRDSGLLHALLGLAEQRDLESHPIYGASWEGLCVEEIVRRYGDTNCWFWATHGGAELDVMAQYRGRRIGFECKLTDAPRITRSMRRAADDLQLDHLYVVYPGDLQFALDEGVTAMPLTRLHQIDGP